MRTRSPRPGCSSNSTLPRKTRAFIDGELWDTVQIIGPDQRIFRAHGVGNLGQLGLTELALATHAPSLEELLAAFPEGEYEFRGTTVEGERLAGTATFTDAIPDGPVILTPEEGAVVDLDAAVISWDPVTEPAGIEIAGYRVSVERGDRGRSLSLELPPETTSVQVPPDFLEPGTDYVFQVVAIEAGGNQTITEGVFDTAEDGLGAEPELCGDETSKCVFLSSTNQNGNLGGLTGADRFARIWQTRTAHWRRPAPTRHGCRLQLRRRRLVSPTPRFRTSWSTARRSPAIGMI
jgi:Fibronectin type III domain